MTDTTINSSIITYPLFDCHFHIIDDSFPLVSNQGYLPPTFSVRDYVDASKQFRVTKVNGGVVVSGSFQLYDQTYLIDALQKLNNSSMGEFVGVTQILSTTTDETIYNLHSKGVRAIRFNVNRGVSLPTSEIEILANRVHSLVGWHSEFYTDMVLLESDTDFKEMLLRLPRIVIDHMGMSRTGFPQLLSLYSSSDRVFVKATGFGRLIGYETENDLKVRINLSTKYCIP